MARRRNKKVPATRKHVAGKKKTNVATPKKQARGKQVKKPVSKPRKKVSKQKQSLIGKLITVLKARITTLLGKGKKVPNGRTLKTKDEYLPQEKGKVKELKDRRWVAVIDSNKENELAVVRLTDEQQKNTTYLPTYKKGNRRKTYFKHFVEIEDNAGNAIIATDSGKFQENPPKYDLSTRELEKIRDKVLNHTKQSSKNRENIDNLKKQKNKR